MNDELYTTLKSDVSEGKYDVLFIASPCTTFSMSRFFTLPGNDPGPPVIHNIDHPDGLPWDQIPAAHHRELTNITKLIGRTTEIARLAIRSPRRTTVIWENPAKRNVKGTTHFCEDFLRL